MPDRNEKLERIAESLERIEKLLQRILNQMLMR